MQAEEDLYDRLLGDVLEGRVLDITCTHTKEVVNGLCKAN